MLEINNTTQQPVRLKKIREIGERFLRAYQKTGWTISVAIVGDAAIKKINQQYRGIDKITDVLSFGGRPADKYLGEVIINIQEAARTNKYRELWREIGRTSVPKPDQVFYFLLVHGLLHLVGHDDETEKSRRDMIKRGGKFLNYPKK